MSLDPRVLVVTGASQGLGRGIARAFGGKGATVYLTGRRAEALSVVADEVRTAGGEGIPVVCDHRDDAQTASLFEQVARRHGRLDVLVNNAAAVYPAELRAEGGFWEKPLKLVDMVEVGLRSGYVAAWHAAPLMVRAGRGLIASISFYGTATYFHGAAYGAAKAGTDKMTYDMAQDLRPHGVSVVSIWPGFVRTEAVADIPPEQVPPDLAALWPLFEHPEFTGLVIEALARDPELPSLSGHALIGAELGLRYGIADLDGKQPVSFRDTMGAPLRFGLSPAT